MDRELEIRTAAQTFELRASSTGPGTLFGYAAVFNRYSQNLGGFVEQVDPHAFDKSLADKVPVMCRGNHEDENLLGTTWAETLRLAIDGVGLPYECDLPDTTSGRDYAALTKRGDVKYSSFAFRTIDDSWSFTEQGFPLRTLLQVQLVDVAPVNSPAYLDTTVAARSFAKLEGRAAPSPAGSCDVCAKLRCAECGQCTCDGCDDCVAGCGTCTCRTDKPRSSLIVPEVPKITTPDGQRATHPAVAAARRRLDLLRVE